MQWPSGLRVLRRTETRASLVIAALLLAAFVLQSALLYAFVSMEALEAGDVWVQHALRSASREIEAGRDPEGTLSDIRRSLNEPNAAARLMNGGNRVASWGTWPASEGTIRSTIGDDERTLADARLMRPGRFLVGNGKFADGRTLEIAIPIDHFVVEAWEVRRWLVLTSIASAGLALLIAVIATYRAFQPLRNATRLLESLGPRSLGHRLPTRGTGDAVDVHAARLNKILADIDQSFERLRAFGSDVAHEFRTPLNRIATVADVARGGNPEEVEEALMSILATTDELARLVDALLLISEVDEGRAAIEFETIDVARHLAKAVALYEPAFTERESPLQLEVSPASIHGVPELFDRVIVNLLENALSHTKPGVRVRVCCWTSAEGVGISVEDSGEGIAPQHLDAIFDRFVRIQTDRRAGHGLGLSLARSIARVHGGELLAESSPMGGARFVWWIPTDSG